MSIDKPSIEFEGDDEAFFKLYEDHQKRLYSFIRSMVFSSHDADEIMQETSIVIWKKMEDFELGSNFMAWSFRIARYQVMNFQKKIVHQKKKVAFSDDLMEELEDTRLSIEPDFGSKWDKLEDCRKKLNEKDQHLIEQIYGLGLDVEELSQKLNRKATSIYRSLRRIRALLEECVSKQELGKPS